MNWGVEGAASAAHVNALGRRCGQQAYGLSRNTQDRRAEDTEMSAAACARQCATQAGQEEETHHSDHSSSPCVRDDAEVVRSTIGVETFCE